MNAEPCFRFSSLCNKARSLITAQTNVLFSLLWTKAYPLGGMKREGDQMGPNRIVKREGIWNVRLFSVEENLFVTLTCTVPSTYVLYCTPGLYNQIPLCTVLY